MDASSIRRLKAARRPEPSSVVGVCVALRLPSYVSYILLNCAEAHIDWKGIGGIYMAMLEEAKNRKNKNPVKQFNDILRQDGLTTFFKVTKEKEEEMGEPLPY